jgi:SAM-dependent methyltransferase
VTLSPRANQIPGRGSYGIDAPYLLAVPAALFIANVVHGIVVRSWPPFAGAALVAGCAALGLHASRRGKFAVWGEILDGLELRGDERVLDVGCGRGAVLVLAARRLTTGRATGVDLWRRGHQSGNAPAATRANAAAEGVAGRVDVATADMTALPFADDSFDVVVSNIAVHNVPTRAGRDRAVDQAVRVLRPGGRLLVADIWGTRGYCRRLLDLGMENVRTRGLGWRVWWSGPWLATRLVTATKPARDRTHARAPDSPLPLASLASWTAPRGALILDSPWKASSPARPTCWAIISTPTRSSPRSTSRSTRRCRRSASSSACTQ